MPHKICHPGRSISELSPNEEEYLEAIFKLVKEKDGKVRVKDIARSLGVKDPSVVEMLGKLKGRGLVVHDRPGVELTPKGKDGAAQVVRRHKLAERLLTDVFNYSLPKVHDMACKLEHVLDDELTEKLDDALGKPKSCPHGGEIPRPGKPVSEPKAVQLTEAGKGEKCLVMKIPEERGAVERLLALNVIPGANVKVLERMPRGALVLLCGDTKVALSRDIASQIRVRARHRYRGGRF
jgi:DtxR family Mn-dependent transcriptional regulator